MFDEWLTEPTPGQKRKLGHRRDGPPTPPSLRQPPPIIPSKTLPPRDPNIPLVGGSLRSSPIIANSHQQQHSFNSLLPLEKQHQIDEHQHIRTPHAVAVPLNEPSMMISPLQSSTSEQILRSPSAIPKNTRLPQSSFNFAIIPIECKYHFKQLKQRCTFVTLKAHQESLEHKYKILENEREEKLLSSFSNQVRKQIVGFITNIIEKSLESKKKGDDKRLENLLLDQMREKAALEIKRIAT
jgi:hypothetical protein